MKKLLVPALLLLCLSAPSQVCFVTSIKGKVDYMGKELRVYDTISYQNVRRLKFAAPGFVTFYSEKGSFKAFYKVDTIAQQHEPVIVFLKDVLRIHGKSVALSSRGGCDCLIPYECVYADPEINDMLLVPDTLFFPARFDHEAYDSGFYFLQWQYNGRVINRRLRTLGNEVIITKEDLYFNDNYYNDPGPEDLVLGLCNYSSGKKMPGIVSKIKPNLISSSSLVDHYKILEKSMTGETPEQIFAAFCTEVYVYYGKPDLCQLKKIIHYKQN